MVRSRTSTRARDERAARAGRLTSAVGEGAEGPVCGRPGGGRRNQLRDVLGRLRRIGDGVARQAHRVERGGTAIDQHGQVARRHRFHRDHGAARGRPAGAKRGRRRRARAAPRADRPRPRRGVAGSSGSSVTRIVSDQAHDPTAARAARQSAGAASPRRGRTSPASSGTSQVPVGVVADGEHDGEEGKARSWPSSASWPTCQRRAVGPADEGSGGSPLGCFREEEGDARGETQIARTGGTGAGLQGQAQQAVGGFERMERRDTGEAVQQVSPRPAPLPTAGCRSGSPVNRSPSRRRRLARRARAAQATEPRPRATSSGRCPAGSGCDAVEVPRLATVSRRAAVRSAGSRRRHPSRSWSGIDEARPATDVAAEIERGERRPVRAVAQEFVRDAPERVARLHRVGPVGRRHRGRRRRAVQGRRDRGARARAPPVRLAPAPPGSERGVPMLVRASTPNAIRAASAVEHRRAPAQSDLAAAHVGHDGTEQLRAAGGPGHPGRQDEDAQRIARQRSPGVPETTGQRDCRRSRRARPARP